jgi:hypothetical protein
MCGERAKCAGKRNDLSALLGKNWMGFKVGPAWSFPITVFSVSGGLRQPARKHLLVPLRSRRRPWPPPGVFLPLFTFWSDTRIPLFPPQ